MNTPDMEWEKEELVRKAERDIGFVVSNPDMYDISVQVKNIVRNLLTSRDTYWKERVRKEVEEYKQFVLNVLDGVDIADGYCNTKAIRFALGSRTITNEDNLK